VNSIAPCPPLKKWGRGDFLPRVLHPDDADDFRYLAQAAHDVGEVLAANLFADAVRDAFDPRMNRTEAGI